MTVTKWHKFFANAREIVATKPEAVPKNLHGVISYLSTNMDRLELVGKSTPIFILDHGDCAWADCDMQSLKVMRENIGYLPIPFKSFVIEVEINSRTMFVLCDFEIENLCCISLLCLDGGIAMPLGYVMDFDPCDENSQTRSIVLIDSADSYCWKNLIALGVASIRNLILRLSTRGVETEVIHGPKFLNKQRERKGKPRIPDVTVIKIGHYYNRAGEKQEYDTRNPVRIHWRRGHTRNVWCGTGDNRRQESRYIFPCLVNYAPGDAIPPQQLRVLS